MRVSDLTREEVMRVRDEMSEWRSFPGGNLWNHRAKEKSYEGREKRTRGLVRYTFLEGIGN